jgi:hypothetical protein
VRKGESEPDVNTKKENKRKYSEEARKKSKS